jgi:hypothetical protein
MKSVAAVALIGSLMLPGVASAGSSTDAALGLGAFAVFNQIISGTGVFGGGRTVVVERPVVYAPAPPPPVVYAPPPAVVYQAPPGVVYQTPSGVVYQTPPGVVYQTPPGVVYQTPPGVVYQSPPVVYAPAPVYGYAAPYPRHGYWRRHWD